VLILNSQREVVYANASSRNILGVGNQVEVLGKRPGDLFGCLHAAESERGCGTTPYCCVCGALLAIQQGLSGKADERECRIVRQGGEGALDLRVRVTPVQIQQKPFLVVAFLDIGAQKRRDVLEGEWLEHMHTSTERLHELLELAHASGPEHHGEFVQMLRETTSHMMEDLQGQRLLCVAERGELKVTPRKVHLASLFRAIRQTFTERDSYQGRQLQCRIDPEAVIVSDPDLLRRVIYDMVKNALEAAPGWEEVRLEGEVQEHQVVIRVCNLAVIPLKVQRQIFQRSFSTKGEARGTGTHRMRILTDRYLNGRIRFSSEEGQGTAFVLELPVALKVR
jgi:signal transduction histidine kinase